MTIVVDADYLAVYPDVARSGMNAHDHFTQFGALEGRLPSRAAGPKAPLSRAIRALDSIKVALLSPVPWWAGVHRGRELALAPNSARTHILYVDPTNTAAGPGIRCHWANNGASHWRISLPCSSRNLTHLPFDAGLMEALGEVLAKWMIKQDVRFVVAQHPAWLVVALAAAKRAGVTALYDHIDAWESFARDHSQAVPENFHDMLHEVAGVSAASDALAERLVAMGCPNVQALKNGVAERFLQFPLSISPSFDAGFFGHVGEWVDVQLVQRLAATCPERRFICVGPGASESQLPANVSIQARRSPDCVPEAMSDVRVGLIPFRKCEVAMVADPIKAYEYMAIGLPVVASHVSGLADIPFVDIAVDGDEFVDLANAAMARELPINEKERMRDWARQHSWQIRRSEFDEWIARHAQ